jgi:hypothetical protein
MGERAYHDQEGFVHLQPQPVAESDGGIGILDRAGMEVASAGLDLISNAPVSPELLEWADIIEAGRQLEKQGGPDEEE